MSESYSEEGPACPHCGRQFTADGPEYYRSDYTEDECDECGGKFNVTVESVTSWTCTAIPSKSKS